MINSIVASGVTESHFQLIERISSTKASQYQKIGFYDFDDLKQEARIKCWSIIDRYNPERGTNIFVFLSTSVDNRFRDIRRSVLYKHNKPCNRCPFWDANAAVSGLHDCVIYKNKMDCSKYSKHERYVKAKLSSNNPMDILHQNLSDTFFDNNCSLFELIDLIENRLPTSLISSFTKFKKHNFDSKSLKPKERKVLFDILRKIISKEY